MNPTDVFPRRNLPGEAEEWGREVEDRIRGVEYGATSQKTGLSSQNRASASSSQELARQIQSLQRAYDSIPKPRQNSGTATAFSLSAGWNTVLSVSLVAPVGVNRLELLAMGSGQIVSTTTTTTVESSSRLNLVGTGESPYAPGAWYIGSGDYRTIMAPSYSWSITVLPGQVITVEFQVYPEDSAAYPGNANNYAVLSLLGTFTG